MDERENGTANNFYRKLRIINRNDKSVLANNKYALVFIYLKILKILFKGQLYMFFLPFDCLQNKTL